MLRNMLGLVLVAMAAVCLSGCGWFGLASSKELEKVKAQAEALQAEKDEATKEAAEKEAKEAREAEVRKAATEAVAEAVKKLTPPAPPTREEREAKVLADNANSPHGQSSVYVPTLDIESATGAAASELQKRMAAKETAEADKELKTVQNTWKVAADKIDREAKKAEKKAAAKAAVAKEKELQTKVKELEAKIKEATKKPPRAKKSAMVSPTPPAISAADISAMKAELSQIRAELNKAAKTQKQRWVWDNQCQTEGHWEMSR